MNKIVKNFNGFKKIYENESQEEIKVETKPEDVKKVEDLIDQSVEQSIQNSPNANKIDQAIQAQSQRESGIKESVEAGKIESFTDETFKFLADQIVKNSPTHRQYGKLKSISFVDEGGGWNHIKLNYEKGSLTKTSTSDEKEHMKNILSDAAQRQKTLQWLASAANIGGAALIALGVGLLVYGIVKRGDLYDQFSKELNNKYGFKSDDLGHPVMPEDQGELMGGEQVPAKKGEPGAFIWQSYQGEIEYYKNNPFYYSNKNYQEFMELREKGFIMANTSPWGNQTSDTGPGGMGISSDGYVWNWDKVMTSDQVNTLSEYNKQFLLNAAVTSGIGGLSLLAGFMLNKSAEKNSSYLSGITCLCKAVLDQFGGNIKMMQTEGDLVKTLSKDFSHLSVG